MSHIPPLGSWVKEQQTHHNSRDERTIEETPTRVIYINHKPDYVTHCVNHSISLCSLQGKVKLLKMAGAYPTSSLSTHSFSYFMFQQYQSIYISLDVPFLKMFLYLPPVVPETSFTLSLPQ